MAILVNGILGGFHGKVGNVVGYQHKNTYCIRQLPHKSGKDPSQAQLAHRMKFRRVMAFLQPLRPLLKLLPDKGSRRISSFNYVFGAILKGAVKGSYPAFDINFVAVQLTWGNLVPGWCHQVRVERKRLIFSACLRREEAERGLQVVLLAYNPAKQSWLFKKTEAVQLLSGAELELPCSFAGDRLETWLFLANADFKKMSPSLYTGSHTVPCHAPCFELKVES